MKLCTLFFLQISNSNFWAVNWYYIAAVSLSTIGVIFAIRNFYKKKRTQDDSAPGLSYSETRNTPISIVNNVNSNIPFENSTESKSPSQEIKSKSTTKILFIDDNYSEYKMVSILKKAGWTNTRGIKDIFDLDNYLVLESDIVFVDINGVGSSMFEDQGLGLASALKNKYPQKKIVIYSAETSGNRFHKALREVDACLQKNAEPYQFIDLVQSLTRNF